MHFVQAALALLASGAAVLIIAGLVRESVHDKRQLSRSSVDPYEQPAVSPLGANPDLSDLETLKSAPPDPVAPVSRSKRERRKANRGGDREARRRRREAKRRERGERSGQRGKEADSDASNEAEDG